MRGLAWMGRLHWWHWTLMALGVLCLTVAVVRQPLTRYATRRRWRGSRAGPGQWPPRGSASSRSSTRSPTSPRPRGPQPPRLLCRAAGQRTVLGRPAARTPQRLGETRSGKDDLLPHPQRHPGHRRAAPEDPAPRHRAAAAQARRDHHRPPQEPQRRSGAAGGHRPADLVPRHGGVDGGSGHPDRAGEARHNAFVEGLSESLQRLPAPAAAPGTAPAARALFFLGSSTSSFTAARQ